MPAAVSPLLYMLAITTANRASACFPLVSPSIAAAAPCLFFLHHNESRGLALPAADVLPQGTADEGAKLIQASKPVVDLLLAPQTTPAQASLPLLLPMTSITMSLGLPLKSAGCWSKVGRRRDELAQAGVA